MGLAFTSLAVTGLTPFWLSLAASGQLDSPVMSFWLTRSTGTSDLGIYGGVLTLGGTNSSLYTGTIEFIDLVQASYWSLSLTSEFPIIFLLGDYVINGGMKRCDCPRAEHRRDP